MHAPRPAPMEDVSATRLVATLAITGALAGLLIVGVFQWADPRIRTHQAMVLREAVQEVLHHPDHYETLFLVDGALAAAAPAGIDSATLDRVYLGYTANGAAAGFAIAGAEPGFQDVIRLIFGWDPESGRILGMKVLDNKETPGLGDKIEKDSVFVGGFTGAATPLRGVRPGAGAGADDEVDMITGATISSRAVIAIINHRLEQLGPALRQYTAGSVTADGVAMRAKLSGPGPARVAAGKATRVRTSPGREATR